MDEASFLEAWFLTASFLLQGKRATLPRLSSSQLQTPHMTALGCLHCGSSRWSWHLCLIITCRPSVQITLPFFWHLAFIKYYNTPVSLCGFSCVSPRYISLWPFYYRKMTVLLTRTKLLKDCLGKMFQLNFILLPIPFHPLAQELHLGLGHRWPKGVASCRQACPTFMSPLQDSSKPLSPLTGFLLSQS